MTVLDAASRRAVRLGARAVGARARCGALVVSALSVVALGCGASRGPVAQVDLSRGAAQTAAIAPDGGASGLAEAPSDARDAAAAAASGPAVFPAPLPPVRKLSRGTGGAADDVLAAADAAYEADDFATAEAKYREASRLSPDDPAPRVGLSRVTVARTNLGTDFNVAPNDRVLGAVAAELKRTVKLDPSFGPSSVELGRVLLMLGKAAEAESALRVAVRFDASDPEAQSALGVALLATGRAAEAVDPLSRAAELDPGSAARQANLGTVLMMQGRVADALRAYEAALRLTPDDARVLGDEGTALLADNQVDAAIAALRRAVELDPKRATLRSNLGYALAQRHEFTDAIACDREAIALDPKLVSARVNLATALALTGDTAGAKKALEQAKRIDPTDPRVLSNLDDLRAMERVKGKTSRDASRGSR